nr:hypothetical protein [Ilumatobacteraceae bacterium]
MEGAEPIDIDLLPPVPGVDEDEWAELIELGRERGELHAEEITHVVRSVELTGETLELLHKSL